MLSARRCVVLSCNGVGAAEWICPCFECCGRSIYWAVKVARPLPLNGYKELAACMRAFQWILLPLDIPSTVVSATTLYALWAVYAVHATRTAVESAQAPVLNCILLLAVVTKIPYIIGTEYLVPVSGTRYRVPGTGTGFPPLGTGTGPVFFFPVGILSQIGRYQ
jgi:hypothetical protein